MQIYRFKLRKITKTAKKKKITILSIVFLLIVHYLLFKLMSGLLRTGSLTAVTANVR